MAFIEIEFDCSVIVLNSSFISPTTATLHLQAPRDLCRCKNPPNCPAQYLQPSVSNILNNSNLFQYQEALLGEYYQAPGNIKRDQKLSRNPKKSLGQEILSSVKKYKGMFV
jgi:hypothetical protein